MAVIGKIGVKGKKFDGDDILASMTAEGSELILLWSALLALMKKTILYEVKAVDFTE